MDITGRGRAQTKTLTKTPSRAWSGDDALARVASIIEVSEPAMCPGCRVISRLVHISTAAALLETQTNIVPCHVPGEVVSQARCILCACASSPVVQTQEAHAGHIWFLIGEDDDTPPQEVLNQHYWAVIEGPTLKHRASARRQILDMAASKEFGGLALPHEVIATDERNFILQEFRKIMGDEAHRMGDKELAAFGDQFGIPLLLRNFKPKPIWGDRVRFVPTPEGVESYRAEYRVAAIEA